MRLGESVLAPVEDQSQLTQVRGRSEGPADGLICEFAVAADLVVKGGGEAWLGHDSFASHESFQLQPARSSALALTPQQPQPLRPEEQAGVLSIDFKAVARGLSQGERRKRSGAEKQHARINPHSF